MARSETIWVVLHKYEGVLGAYTVKHELARWLNDLSEYKRNMVTVLRVPDGVWGWSANGRPPQEFVPDEILDWRNRRRGRIGDV